MIRLSFLLAGALLVAGALPARAGAAFPGRNGEIAVSARFEGDGANNSAPDWSGDGRRLAYFAGFPANTYATMAPDGSAVTPLGLSPVGGRRLVARPSLSRRGMRIAFTRGSAVWTARLDGTDQRRLRAGLEPRYSPDGRTIAYISVSSAHPPELWLMGARTGRRIRRLARVAGDPEWAPDGRSLVYSRRTSGTSRDLFVVRADGRRTRGLTSSRTGDEFAPAWSPDGRWIAFARGAGGERPHRGDIAYVRAGGGSQHTIVSVPALDADTLFEAA